MKVAQPKRIRVCPVCYELFACRTNKAQKACSRACAGKMIAGTRRGCHVAGEYTAVCVGCGGTMTFAYHCHAKNATYCSRECYANTQRRKAAAGVPVKNQYSQQKAEKAKTSPRYGCPWTDEDDAVLAREFLGGFSTDEMAVSLGRTVNEVRGRVTRLGLVRPSAIVGAMRAEGGRKNKGNKRPDLAAWNRAHPLHGSANHFYGKKHSEKTRKAISEYAKTAKRFQKLAKDPEFQRKRQAAQRLAFTKPEVIERWHRAQALARKSPNKTERKLDALIQSVCPGEYKFTGDGSFLIGTLNPDWTNVNGKMKVIELFGEHVHSDGGMIEPSFIQTYMGRKMTLADHGYETLIIWSRELKDMDAVAAKLREFHAISCN